MKKKFRLEDYKGKYAMHCDTEEKAKKFLRFLNDSGRKWKDGGRYIEDVTLWSYKKEETSYLFNSGVVACGQDAKDYGGYKVLEFDDFDWNGLSFLKEDVKMDKTKFKKGDVVVIKKDLSFATNSAVNCVMEKLAGRKAKIVSVFSHDQWCSYRLDIDDERWAWTSEMFEKPVKKIVITTDGRTTEAKLYQNGQTIKSAKAICSYDDEFDFMTGARTAFLRLDDEFPKECSLNKPKYYYTGKVICIEKPWQLPYTIGKTYLIKDGVLRCDDGGWMVNGIEDVDDLNQRSLAKWIEAVE